MLLSIMVISIGYYDYQLNKAYEDMPTSSIEATTVGDHVKVEGRLKAETRVAVDGKYLDGIWRWATKTALLQSKETNSSILLDFHDARFLKGLHPSETPGASGYTCYWSNDSIVAIGTVAINSSGDKIISVEILKPASSSFTKDDVIWAFIIIPSLFWGSIVIFFLGTMSLTRNRP